jgi:ankyrin repeat protein
MSKKSLFILFIVLSAGISIPVQCGKDETKPSSPDAVDRFRKAQKKGEAVRQVMCGSVNPNLRDEDGQTPLFFAALGFPRLVKPLLDAGSDANIQDNYGYTPLISLLETIHSKNLAMPMSPSELQLYQVAAIALINKTADINVTSKEGMTPLGYAATIYPKLIKLMIAKGANINAQNNKGFTPLLTAILKNHVAIIGPLIVAGADTNAGRCILGKTPLTAAAMNKNPAIIDTLIAAGADPANVTTMDGRTSWHLGTPPRYTGPATHSPFYYEYEIANHAACIDQLLDQTIDRVINA